MSLRLIFHKAPFQRTLIFLIMMSILALIAYFSSRSTSVVTTEISSQTGEDNTIIATGDALMTGDTTLLTGSDYTTSAFTTYPAKYFVDTKEADGSCTSVVIQDTSNQNIEVPNEIDETLHCIGGSEVLSHSYRFLLYGHSAAPDYKTIDLKTYDFISKKTQTLMSFNNTIDGMSCQRRDDDSYIACVVINQTDYPGSTKVFILQIHADGSLAKKQVFPQTNNTRVGFHCASSCYPGDFRWEGTRILQYEGQDNGDDILTGKTYSIQYE